jgi:hypothetical protein
MQSGELMKFVDPTLSLAQRTLPVILAAAASLAASAIAENLPDMRPALVGSDSKALINLIDTQSLMKRGQGHAALFFNAVIRTTAARILLSYPKSAGRRRSHSVNHRNV